jgi:predicted AlkP superfamily pyrophosphatase or phosphodiesterase
VNYTEKHHFKFYNPNKLGPFLISLVGKENGCFSATQAVPLLYNNPILEYRMNTNEKSLEGILQEFEMVSILFQSVTRI